MFVCIYRVSTSTNTLNKSNWFVQKVSFFNLSFHWLCVNVNVCVFHFIVIWLQFYLHNICVIGLLFRTIDSHFPLFSAYIFVFFYFIHSFSSNFFSHCLCMFFFCCNSISFSLPCSIRPSTDEYITVRTFAHYFIFIILCCWCMLSSMNKLFIYFVYVYESMKLLQTALRFIMWFHFICSRSLSLFTFPLLFPSSTLRAYILIYSSIL